MSEKKQDGAAATVADQMTLNDGAAETRIKEQKQLFSRIMGSITYYIYLKNFVAASTFMRM